MAAMSAARRRQLSAQPNTGNPRWSQDGRQILFDADGDRDGWQELWLMNADGSGQRQIFDLNEEGRRCGPTAGRPRANTSSIPRSSTSTSPASGTGRGLPATRRPESVSPFSEWLTGSGLDMFLHWRNTDPFAPASAVRPLPSMLPARFTVQWDAADAGSIGRGRGGAAG